MEGSINKGQTCTDPLSRISAGQATYRSDLFGVLIVWECAVGLTRQERSGKCALSELRRRFTESLTWWPGWPRGATTCRFQRGPEYIYIYIYTGHHFVHLSFVGDVGRRCLTLAELLPESEFHILNGFAKQGTRIGMCRRCNGRVMPASECLLILKTAPP